APANQRGRELPPLPPRLAAGAALRRAADRGQPRSQRPAHRSRRRRAPLPHARPAARLLDRRLARPARRALVHPPDPGRPRRSRGVAGADRAAAGPPLPHVAAERIAVRANEITAELDAPAAGLVVLLEPHFPGWKLTIDGARVPL